MNATIYQLPEAITTEKHVYDFFGYLYFVESTAFHPDDSFSGYINHFTREPAFDDATCAKYDQLMDQAHRVCGDHVYDIGLKICQIADILTQS